MSDEAVVELTATKPKRGIVEIVKISLLNFLAHDCTLLAAAIVYYTIQSLVPLLLGFIVVASLVLQDEATKKQFVDGVNNAIPADVSKAIDLNSTLDNLAKGAGAIGLISIVLLLWTGSGIFAQFMVAINKAFGIPKDTRKFVVKLGLRLVMLPILGGLFIASIVISAGLQIILGLNVEIAGFRPANLSFLLGLLSYLTPFLLQGCIFAILYRLSPNRKGLRWKPIFIGGFIASFLFEVLKLFFSFYIRVLGAADNAAKTYGALGGIIVFLLFVYLTGVVILLGAEFASTLHNFEDVPATATTPKLETEEAVPSLAAQAVADAPKLPREKKSLGEVVVGAVFLLGVMISTMLFQRKKS